MQYFRHGQQKHFFPKTPRPSWCPSQPPNQGFFAKVMRSVSEAACSTPSTAKAKKS